MLAELIAHVSTPAALDSNQVATAVRALVDPGVPAEAKAEFLTALAKKGETPDEIAAFARELRALSEPVPLADSLRSGVILDVCGTGGDRLNTFNISTTVALVCAAAGCVVAKHGNRAITSQAGSADVLQALGVPIDQTPAQVADSLARHGFAFLFAPNFHPAFKHIAPARKLCAERGQRTLFNFMGPLLNPARPTAQLVGVSRPAVCEPIARTLQMLGLHRAMVVCGEVTTEGAPAYLDELSTLGENTVAEFYQERAFHTSHWSPTNLPLQGATLADLAGGDAATNARIIEHLLTGKERGPKRDAVLLNAAAALQVSGRARSIIEGWEIAAGVLDSGNTNAKLNALRR
ncbi:MAG TPA: anthranilate phosphoribosyltransferase [Verrucomicrobiota bacterium]|nr:anthranilate phosphoribosyltransferase [Verrucomicrobiales bacterium]HRI13315.1 anthranilate phosphoribosyltransferase [Verrucomicrobiota bacterium]